VISLAGRLRHAAERLAAVSDTPRLDAEILMAHVLGCSRAALMARLRDPADDAPGFDALLERRLAWEPVAYLLGSWEFFSLEFAVAPPLLVPRPETEHLLEAVLEHAGTQPMSILEIGTGTGCVAVALAVSAPAVRVVATDIQPKALEVAGHNAGKHRCEDRVSFRSGPFFEPVLPGETFDAVCSNPPYVEARAYETLSPTIREHEDPGALIGGEDGLDCVRAIVAGARHFLRPGGLLAIEIGDGQYGAVQALMTDAGYADARFVPDLAGIERIALCNQPEGV
jgi:release factor glutamine methyltransferase